MYGIVVYIGKDTKVAFHLKQQGWRGKRSPILDDVLDKAFLAIIYIIGLTCFMILILDWTIPRPWLETIMGRRDNDQS
jgi:hypothetical protein